MSEAIEGDVTASDVADHAGRILAAAAPRRSKVILFGSQCRGDGGPGSDFDFLVVEPAVTSKAEEMVRLRAALDPLHIAADIVVLTRAHVEEWGEVPGTLVHEALTEGRVLAET